MPEEGRCRCCCTLQTGCILVGVFMGIWSGVGLIFEIVYIDTIKYSRDHPFTQKQKQALLNVLWLLFVCYLASLVIGILLCLGACKRSVAMCKIWLFGNPILRILIVIFSALSIHFGLFDDTKDFITEKEFAIFRLVIGTMIVVGTGIWFSWVVFAFIKEIQGGPDPGVGVMVVPQYGQPMSPYPVGGEVVQYAGQEYGGFPQQPQTASQHLQMNQAKFAPPGGTTPPPTEMAT